MWRTAHLLMALTAATSWPSGTASAQPFDGSICTEARDLVDFTLSQTGYPEPDFCPRVLIATDAALLSSVAFSVAGDPEQPIAVYLPTTNDILLSEEIDPESPLGRSFLVHELVHALQFQAGAVGRTPCLGALEAEAYRVQSAYLEQEGLARLAKTYRFHALLVASCVHAYHPDF